jgi:hypothetical protein
MEWDGAPWQAIVNKKLLEIYRTKMIPSLWRGRIAIGS